MTKDTNQDEPSDAAVLNPEEEDLESAPDQQNDDASSEAGQEGDPDFWGHRVARPEQKATGSTASPADDDNNTDPAATGNSSLEDVERSEIEAEGEHIKKQVQPDRIEWREDYTKLDDVYAKSYVLGEWPHETRPHFMQSLWENSGLTFDVSLHFENHSRADAVSVLAERQDALQDKATGEFAEYIPNSEAIEETLKIIKDMKRRVENEGEPFVSVSIVLTVYANDEESLERTDRNIREALEVEAGFSAIAPNRLPERALVSSSPLNTDLVSPLREESGQPMLGTAASHTFPFINDTVIEEGGVMMGKNMADDTPVLLDLFNRNNGYNKLVIGDIGSGKSFSEGQYLLRHKMANPEDNIIIIDPMGGYVGVNKAIGGDRIVVNGNETINPLQISKTPDEILEKKGDQLNPYRMKLEDVRWFFNRFFQEQNSEIGSDQWAVLDRAIKRAYRAKGITPDPHTHDNPSPTIRDIMRILGEIAENPTEFADTGSQQEVEFWETNASYLLMSLEPFREGNELDNLVGETDLYIDSDTPTYIDMQQMDGREDLGLIMKIVFSMIYEEIKESDGRTIVAIDEAHKIIGDEQAADHWQEIFRHSRHHDASIHLLSQEFEDFFGTEDATEDRVNEAAKTMANQCTVRRIQRVSNVNRKLAKEAVDLTDSNIDFIENAVAGEEQRGYTTALLQVDDIGTIGLRIEPTEAEIAAIDYDPDNVGQARDLDSVQSKRIRRAIKVDEGLADPLPTPDEDGIIRELVSQIDVTNLSRQGIEAFVQELVEDDSTHFDKSDEEYLIEKFDPDSVAATDEERDQHSDADETDESVPPWEQSSTPKDAAPQQPSPDVQSADAQQPEALRDGGHEVASEPSHGGESESTQAASSKSQSHTHQENDDPSQSESEPNTGMSFDERVEQHQEVVAQFPNELLAAIAANSPYFADDDTPKADSKEFVRELAEYHARAEVDTRGQESSPRPKDLPAEHEKIARQLHKQRQSADD